MKSSSFVFRSAIEGLGPEFRRAPLLRSKISLPHNYIGEDVIRVRLFDVQAPLFYKPEAKGGDLNHHGKSEEKRKK
ncbi:hypothetical protein ACJ73_10100 [Blastomyces percursus]|uniref:Uncharacterized protein n=1 Tax=Blastomyces percursus TaxID=1658174 RepID=A0A1J9Q0H4_9EURO|nr:hypothetical protein ACJ73_10100 [Blastomyces percursus]